MISVPLWNLTTPLYIVTGSGRRLCPRTGRSRRQGWDPLYTQNWTCAPKSALVD